MPENFYELLGVAEDATKTEIKAAYREMAREYHPDVNDDDRASAQFKTVRKAYEVLSDGKERAAYDRMGHGAYVNKRLDGLPDGMPDMGSRWSRSRRRTTGRSDSSATRNRGGSSANRSRGGSTSGRRTDTGSSTNRSRTSSTNRSRTSSTSSKSTSSSKSSESSNTTSTGSSASRTRSSGETSASASDASATTAGADSAGGAKSTGRSTRTRRTRQDATGASTAGSRTNASSASTASDRRRRERASDASASATSSTAASPLRYGWLAVLLATGLYVAGLAWYLRANAGATAAFAANLLADPTTALTAPHGISSPTAFVRAAIATPSIDLLLPLGAVALSIALAGTVYRFGRGTAWLYVGGGATPLIALTVGPLLPPAAAVDVLFVVVLPIVAAVVFLGDVGRFLFSRKG